MRTPWLPMLVLALVGCRDHVLDDGTYAFATGAVLRDDCGLSGTSVLGTGVLRTEGHLVTLTLSQPDLRLAGSYRANAEAFYVDGSLLKSSAVLRGRECVLDTITVHADATTLSDTSFNGTMSVAYDTAQPEACVCRYWFEYTATRQ